MSSEPVSVCERKPSNIQKVTTTENATTVSANVIIPASAAAAMTEHEEFMARIGKMIQDLFRSDNANVNAVLDALNEDLMKDKEKRESLVTAGGCFVLVQLLKNCLEKAIGKIPAWYSYQITDMGDFPELTTLHKTLNVMTNLTFRHAESRFSMTAIGGVEAVVKILKTFPKCKTLQERACDALRNLAYCSIGKAKAIESGGMEVLLAAVTTHLGCAIICQKACWALFNMAFDSKENTWLLISLGGGAAVAKVSTQWPDDGSVQTKVRGLANLIASEMKALAADEY